MSQTKGTWKYTLAELGAGIECSVCGHKLKAMTVVMGDISLDICPFCNAKMTITQDLIDRMKEELI